MIATFSRNDFLNAPTQYTERLLDGLGELPPAARSQYIGQWGAEVAKIGVAIDTFALACGRYIESRICDDMGISMAAWASRTAMGEEIRVMYNDAKKRYDRKEPLYRRIKLRWGRDVLQHALFDHAVHDSLRDLAKIGEAKYSWEELLEYLRYGVFLRLLDDWRASEQEGKRFDAWRTASLYPCRQDFDRVCARSKAGVKLQLPDNRQKATAEHFRHTLPGRPLKILPNGLLGEDPLVQQNMSLSFAYEAPKPKPGIQTPLQVALENNRRNLRGNAESLPGAQRVEQQMTSSAGAEKMSTYEGTSASSRKRTRESQPSTPTGSEKGNKRQQIDTPKSTTRSNTASSKKQIVHPSQQHAASALLNGVQATRAHRKPSPVRDNPDPQEQQGGDDNSTNRSPSTPADQQVDDATISVAEEEADELRSESNAPPIAGSSTLEDANEENGNAVLPTLSSSMSHSPSTGLGVNESFDEAVEQSASETINGVDQGDGGDEEEPDSMPSQSHYHTPKTGLQDLVLASALQSFSDRCACVLQHFSDLSAAREELEQGLILQSSSKLLRDKCEAVSDELKALQRAVEEALELRDEIEAS